MHRIDGANYTTDSAGKRKFTDGPPGTSVPATFLNALQEEISNVIEQSGIQLYPDGTTDSKTQLWEAIQATISPHDGVISSQTQFAGIVERVAANQYKIKDDYRNLFFKFVTGGYSISGILSGGDTWGYLETNNCAHIEFESGAYLDFGTTIGYFKANTLNGYLKNVWIKGDNSSASAITQSILLENLHVTFDNCKISERNSNVDMAGFQGSGTILHNITSKYINCSSFTLDGSDKIYGFKDCFNLSNCIAYDIESSGDISYGYQGCENLSTCFIYQLDNSASASFGFSGCNQLVGCKAEGITTSSGNAVGFQSCNQLAGCYAGDVDSPSNSHGFESCNQLAGCQSYDIDSSGSNVYAFQNCNQVVGCYADKVDYSGAGAFDANGFRGAQQIAGCKANDIDVGGAGSAEGFAYCDYGSSLFTSEAVNSNNDWMDTVDADIANKVSTPSIWT
jgi:hypothetical protein